MLEALAKEYTAVCAHLVKTDCRQKRNYLIVEKAALEAMLDRNKYETASNKLKLWKRLHWIDADEDRLTKRVYDKEKGGYASCVKLNLGVYDALKSLDGK